MSTFDDFLVEYAKTYAFETWIKVPSMGTYKAIATINIFHLITGHTNSKVFDSVWKKECGCNGLENFGNGDIRDCRMCGGTGYLEPYDLMITFVRRKDKLWNVSLYSTKPEIDCGAIAKSFGGGGHKGAARFQCKELPFEY